MDTHKEHLNRQEIDLLKRLREIVYNGKIELWDDDYCKDLEATFGDGKKWQVEKSDRDSKNYPWIATSGAICSDYKTKKQAIKGCKEINEDDSKQFKVMR